MRMSRLERSDKRNRELRLLRYELPSEVVALSTFRQGGYSTGNYESFNVNSYCGDDPAHVAKNRQMLCHKLGIADNTLIIPHQVHDTQALIVDEPFVHSLGDEKTSLMLEGKDAVITNLRRICVAVSTADCVPILVYDSNKRAVAAVHAGWRGTVKKIICETLQAMHAAYGTESEFVRVVIGPHIRLQAFEVGDEVYGQFENAGFLMHTMTERIGGRWHIDLSKANRFLLNGCGIKDSQIYDCGICCYTESTRFFSARRLGVDSGRTLSGIMLS